MNKNNSIIGELRQTWGNPYHLLDRLYVPRDKKHLRRTRNIRLIPNERNRRGGKYAYAGAGKKDGVHPPPSGRGYSPGGDGSLIQGFRRQESS